MKWPAFAYAKARSLDEAFALRAKAGEEAKWIAGGQSLLAGLAFRLSAPSALIDISDVPELKGRSAGAAGLRIGALTTHAELGRCSLVARGAPLLAQAAPLIAHAAIRNRGTLGGNLAYADPASELPACLVALDATLILRSARGARRAPAAAFFLGLFETALAPDELIEAVEVAPPAPGARASVMEIARRNGDYAMAGLAAWRGPGEGGESARLVFFGMGEAPVHARRASAALVQSGIAAAQAALADDLSPLGDQQASAEMKLHLARVLAARVARALDGPREAAA